MSAHILVINWNKERKLGKKETLTTWFTSFKIEMTTSR